MSSKDSVVPFVFDALAVRGAVVQLEGAWSRIQQEHGYPRPVANVLGHSAAATSLIAQSLKFDGSITLQINGDGPLSMLVMQCTDNLDIRGMATASEVSSDADFATWVTNARCAVTVDAGAMERPYQGIVEVNAGSLAMSLENYFEQSVQVPSHLALCSDASLCGGILLQQMPGEKPVGEDDWRRLGALGGTLRTEDLLDGATSTLLQKLFVEDDVRVFPGRSVQFRCRCSQARVEEVLRLLGEAETRAALLESGRVDVTCEYCGQMRRFVPIDVGRVFADQSGQGSVSIH